MDLPVESGQIIQEARELLSQGKPAEAETILRQLLETRNSDAETNSLLGAALSMQGRDAESLPYLERAVGLDHERAPYYYNLGAIVEKLGDSVRATECYRRAVELDAHYARAAQALQRLYRSGIAVPPAQGPTPSVVTPPIVQGGTSLTDLAGNPVEPTSQQSPFPGTGAAFPGQPLAPSATAAAAPRPDGNYDPRVVIPRLEWKDAPSAVRAVRLLVILGLIIAGLLMLAGGLMLSSPAGPIAGISLIAGGVFAFVIGILYIKGLTSGFTPIWYVQLVLSSLGVVFGIINLLGILMLLSSGRTGADASYNAGTLFGGVLGLLIHSSILYYWVQRETKVWFKLA